MDIAIALCSPRLAAFLGFLLEQIIKISFSQIPLSASSTLPNSFLFRLVGFAYF